MLTRQITEMFFSIIMKFASQAIINSPEKKKSIEKLAEELSLSKN